MSETDDTDVLLIIPPNFFLVQSSGSDDSLLESSRTVVHKPQSCTAQVLGKLVNQVHTLESRLETLEVNSDISSVRTSSRRKIFDTTDSIGNQSLERKCFTFPRRRRKRTVKRERKLELSLTSLDSLSTRGKTVPSLKFEENISPLCIKYGSTHDTLSMDGDISSIVSTPSKINDKLLLHEIDEFLTKVEAYEGPDRKYKDEESCLSPENVIKATGDYITQQLDSKNSSDNIQLPSGRIVPCNILDKYIYLVKNGPTSHEDASKLQASTSYKSTEYNSSQTEVHTKSDAVKPSDTKSPSVRRLNFSDKDVQPTSTPKKSGQSCLESFRPSSNKIYDRATRVLDLYKSQNQINVQSSISDVFATSPKKGEFKVPQMRPYIPDSKDNVKLTALQNKFMDSIDTDLLSLSDLWGERAERERGERVETLKLEEERLKREHCESMIQQLQKKILEQQEKLAVAVKVDRAKDAAIAKLREAWLRLTSSLDKAEDRHRAALEKMVKEVENFKIGADDAQKKTIHFEAELYKTLDLAHDYQEKCKQLSAEKKEMQDNVEKTLAQMKETLAGKDREIEALRENYDTVMRLNKQSTDCVKNLEEALEKERSEHEETRREAGELSGAAALLRREADLREERGRGERARAQLLEGQLADLRDQHAQLLDKCEAQRADSASLRRHLELQKTELRAHYQAQLEQAVLGKLRDFQQQLDEAERRLQASADAARAALLDQHHAQLAALDHQHKLEINVLEEKQREEIKLYRLQLAQASERVGLLKNKVESYRRRRGQLAAQLHGVMEAQWRQALRILTHPAPSATPKHTADTSAELCAPDSERGLQRYVHMLLQQPAGCGDDPDIAANLDIAANAVSAGKAASASNADKLGCAGDSEDPTSDRPRARRTPPGKPPWKA